MIQSKNLQEHIEYYKKLEAEQPEGAEKDSFYWYWKGMEWAGNNAVIDEPEQHKYQVGQRFQGKNSGLIFPIIEQLSDMRYRLGQFAKAATPLILHESELERDFALYTETAASEPYTHVAHKYKVGQRFQGKWTGSFFRIIGLESNGFYSVLNETNPSNTFTTKEFAEYFELPTLAPHKYKIGDQFQSRDSRCIYTIIEQAGHRTVVNAHSPQYKAQRVAPSGVVADGFRTIDERFIENWLNPYAPRSYKIGDMFRGGASGGIYTVESYTYNNRYIMSFVTKHGIPEPAGGNPYLEQSLDSMAFLGHRESRTEASLEEVYSS